MTLQKHEILLRGKAANSACWGQSWSSSALPQERDEIMIASQQGL